MSQATYQNYAGNNAVIGVSLYEKLAASSERLSTNLWVKFAVDDTSAFDIKELSRADIASLKNAEMMRELQEEHESEEALFGLEEQALTYALEYPNVAYSFDCTVSYTGSAKILSQTYVINKFSFLGESAVFEFRRRKSSRVSDYYPHCRIVSAHQTQNNGSYFVTFAICLEGGESHDIEYTIQFDSANYRIDGLNVHYHKK